MDSGQSELFVEFPSPFGEGACLKYDPVLVAKPEFPRILRQWIDAFPHLQLPESLQSAALERQLSYVAGRYCAGLALKRAGSRNLRIGYGNDRSPMWPEGWLGSITHSRDGAVGAVVAKSKDVFGLGIDFEQWIGPVESAEIAGEVATSEEVGRIQSGLPMSASEALTVAFAAKEAFYKALAPKAGEFFGFFDAEIMSAGPTTQDSKVRIRLLKDLRNSSRVGTERMSPGFEAQGRLFVTPDKCKILFVINNL